MKNWLEAKVGRGGFIRGSAVLATGLLLPFTDFRTIQSNELPFVITGHGLNGSSESGFIGDLNTFLYQNKIPFDPLDFRGGMNPNRDEWREDILRAIRRAPKAAKLVLYSLSGLPGLEAASDPSIELDSLSTVSIRKIHPSLPIDFPWNLVDFYLNSQINIYVPQLIKNTPNGRLVSHSRDDGVVWFDNNAPELSEQIKAETFFVNGRGHFDQPIPKEDFEKIARRIIFS